MNDQKIFRKSFYLIILLTLSCCINASFAGNDAPVLLRIGNVHFDPLKDSPRQNQRIKAIRSYDKGKTGYYIVQFEGPIRSSHKKALTDKGAEIFDYLPDFAFIIRLNSEKEQAVRSLAHVRWLGIYQPSYRISRSAADRMFENGKRSNDREPDHELLRVTVFPGEDIKKVKADIASTGGIILEEAGTKWKTTFKVKAPRDNIADLPSVPGIKWVEPFPVWELFNDVSTDIMDVRTPRDTHGLYGEGQVVGVCDSGLDRGSADPENLHDDFEDGSGNSRVTVILDLVKDGASDVISGHGTHVAGSVLGNGAMSGSDPQNNYFPPGAYAGTAPKASLVFQALVNNASGSLSGIPPDLNHLFSQAHVAGAHLHTNSWGANLAGQYSSWSEDVDEYIWDHKDFLILYSAGNSGMDMDADGVIDLYSLGAPSTAKNCLTVGASEGYRPSGAGYDYPWAIGSWAFRYSAEPISSDHMSDNQEGMAAFSSRGPVLDGRYKPDMVAPGTNIASTRSSQASESGWGIIDDSYMWMGGTSMATPLAAGAAALMREYLTKNGSSNPSAALIKAALINSAEDISPGQYGSGETREIPDSPVPNNVEGWGRLNLENGVYPGSGRDILYYEDQDGLSTDQTDKYYVSVSAGDSPLKINLVWTDYPGAPAAQGGLVNDLDLQVNGPSSTVSYPDNALQESTLTSLYYYENDYEPDMEWSAHVAVKFTPASYPAHVESTMFPFYNPDSNTTSVDVVVYDDDGPGGLPGTELYRNTLARVPSGFVTTGLTGVTVTSGDFYIGVDINDPGQFIYQDNSTSTGRSYYYLDGSWQEDAGHESWILANVRGIEHSTSFDRVNNVVGLTLEDPDAGTITITVSGYNIPQGPQPYALVVSGPVEAVKTPRTAIYGVLNAVYSLLLGGNDGPDEQGKRKSLSGPVNFRKNILNYKKER